jgi:hypothetical protein
MYRCSRCLLHFYDLAVLLAGSNHETMTDLFAATHSVAAIFDEISLLANVMF